MAISKAASIAGLERAIRRSTTSWSPRRRGSMPGQRSHPGSAMPSPPARRMPRWRRSHARAPAPSPPAPRMACARRSPPSRPRSRARNSRAISRPWARACRRWPAMPADAPPCPDSAAADRGSQQRLRWRPAVPVVRPRAVCPSAILRMRPSPDASGSAPPGAAAAGRCPRHPPEVTVSTMGAPMNAASLTVLDAKRALQRWRLGCHAASALRCGVRNPTASPSISTISARARTRARRSSRRPAVQSGNFGMLFGFGTPGFEGTRRSRSLYVANQAIAGGTPPTSSTPMMAGTSRPASMPMRR